MKVFKRNAIILTMIVFVCAAVYLNWAYNKGDKTVSTKPSAEAVGSSNESGLYYQKDNSNAAASANDYFSAVRLERSQARDAAMNTLNASVETMSISQTARDEAVAEITGISKTALTESEMESMIKAKGFSDCVVYLKDKAVIVTVASPENGLTDSSVAQIADIVLQETSITLDQIRIHEVKI